MKISVGPVEVKLIDGDRIADHVAKKGSFEPASLEAWAKMVKSGKTAVDVGAYTGLFSISAALLGADVVAIEPIKRLVDRLLQNARINGVKLSLHQVAASDTEGQGSIAHNPAVAFSAGASIIRKKGPREPVKLATLDSLGLVDVAAIKIDVERNEAAVLRGARKTLEKWRPSLLVEALDADLRAAVMREIPDYKLVGVLDVRNLHLEPR